MTVSEKYEQLSQGINPRKQFVAIHRGRVNDEGAVVEPPRKDQDGGPLLDVFLVKNEQEVRINGWEPFTPPEPPKEVKSRTRKTRTKTSAK